MIIQDQFKRRARGLIKALPETVEEQPSDPTNPSATFGNIQMRLKGKLRTWNDDKGYGFILPESGGKDVFLHISAFRNRDRRPEVGLMVTYTLSTDQQGRPRVSEATLPVDRLTRNGKQKGLLGAILISGVFLSLITWSVLTGQIPAVVLWGYLGISLLTFLMYAYDKTAAKDGAWRTKESTLHWLSLAGGWPGALLAQQALRHKSRNERFRMAFWFTVIINCGVLGWIYTPDGIETLQNWIADGADLFGGGHKATVEWSK